MSTLDIDAIERTAKLGKLLDPYTLVDDVLALVGEVRRLRAVRYAAEDALNVWGEWGRGHERPQSVATAMHHLKKALADQ